MPDYSSLSQELLYHKANVILENKKTVIGGGEEGAADLLSDTDWVRQTLRAGSLEYDSAKDDLLRFWSAADTKFEDTTLGGNYTINPRPQFTRYADTRARGISGTVEKIKVSQPSIRTGMGHYYAEAIDDTHQTIHMIFGQPEFNSLGNYFTNFFNLDASKLASGGKWSQAIADFFKTGATLFVGFIFWPITLVLYGLGKIEEIISYLKRAPASKYYYMRPNMQLYWATVGNIVNKIAATSGMTSFTSDGNVFQKVGQLDENHTAAVNEDYKNVLSQHFSDMFNENGYINMQRIANRSQRMRIAYYDELEKSGGVPPSMQDYVKTLMRGRTDKSTGVGGASLAAAAEALYMDEAKKFEMRFNSEIGNWQGDTNGSTKTVPSELTIRSTLDPSSKKVKPDSALESALQSFRAEWNDGSAFATFRVDHTGSVDESFSSSTGESDLAATFNSTSAQIRQAKNSLAGGNIAGDNLIGAGVGAVINAVKGIAEGTLAAFNLDGILAPGNAYADIPEFWQNSSARMPSMSYSMDLVSPYGDPLSRMMNIFIPLSMIIAAALPLSHGKQSYGSPFLCQVFDQGRAITRLGIVDSLQVSRGTSNLAFNKRKEFMAVNVTFTVKELSTVMHMPVGTGGSLDPLKGFFDEDTLFSDYIGVLSSLSLGKSWYLSEKIKIRALNKWREYQGAANTYRWIAWLHERTVIGLSDIPLKGTDRY